MQKTYRQYVLNLLYDSYTNKLGHIPSALSVLPITIKLKNIQIPIILGKTFGIQAWFIDPYIKEYYLNHKEYRIITKDFFKESVFDVKYCQQQLGLAAGFSIGYSILHKECICLLSDADIFLQSTISAIDLVFKLNIPVCFIIDSNKCQLFNSKSVIDIIKKYNYKEYSIEEFVNSSINTFPCIIAVNTIKGFGVSTLEKNPKDWHYKVLSFSDYNKFVNEITV